MTTPETSRFSKLPPHSGRGPDIFVYQIPSTEIGFMTSLVEAYEGIGLVRTLDRERGIIEVWCMPDFRESLTGILASLRRQFPIQPMSRDFD